MRTFVNPIYGGEDPFITKGSDGFYYHCAEAKGARAINVYKSERLTDRGIRREVFRAPDEGWNSHDVWAPEMWEIGGKWYIYYCASSATGIENWQNHRVGVLMSDDPMGPYTDMGKLGLGEFMSIDATVLQLDRGELYLVYMRRETPSSKLCLYIAPMDSPTHISGEPRPLSIPEFSWEGTINEGPIPVFRDGKIRIIYSANAAGCPDYCLAVLSCNDRSRILEKDAWTKHEKPFFKAKGNVLGPGHASITVSPDGKEDWLVYHSKCSPEEEWPECWNRFVNIQKFTWDDDAYPIFGEPVQLGTPVPVPSGEKEFEDGKEYHDDFSGNNDGWMELNYFAGDSIRIENGKYLLDASLDISYGEKALLRSLWRDFTLETEFSVGGSGASGIIFRASDVGDRKCLYSGYSLMISENGVVTLTESAGFDGKKTLLSAKTEKSVKYKLSVTVSGDRLAASVNGKTLPAVTGLAVSSGFAGLISEEARAAYTFFKIKAI